MAKMIPQALQDSGKPSVEDLRKQYKLHSQRTWVQVGGTFIMWLFALAAYVLDLIQYRHFFGVSLTVLYLIAIHPIKLWVFKRIQVSERMIEFLLFINFLEIIGYTLVIYFMGGIEATYLTVLYATVIAPVGTVSRRQHTFLVAGICIVAYNTIILLEGANLIPWYKVFPDFHLPWAHRLTRMFVVDGLLLLIAHITSYTATLLRKAKNNLQTAYDVLEQRVAERTKELSIANDELKSHIVERKKAEESIRASQERFLTVLNSIDATIYVADMETYEIIFMNKNMIETFGKDFTGEKCWKVFRGESKPCHDCTNEKLIDENGKPVGVYAWQGQNRKTDKWYTNFDRAIKWTDGRLVRLEIATDITDSKKMEQELQQSRKMESIGTLAGGIAHDFNNILFPILGHTEMLLTDIPKDSPYQDNMKAIHTSVLRAKNLVKQILTFSRQDVNELQLMKIQPIVEESLKLTRSTIPTTIEIKQDINADCGLIKADPTQIHQIVMNLTTNAYHAMEETGGQLKVSLKQIKLEPLDLMYPKMAPGVYACLIVADTGAGMDKNVTDKIFDPFFTTKAIGKGTGMGLSMVHGIVTKMGGAVQVYSELGKGTVFHVYFPIEKDSYKELATHSKAQIQGGTEQVLIVDDEEAILTMEKQMLERLGYQVTSRVSSLEALEAFRANPGRFDIVITDMAMPNMSGDKLSAELTEIRSDIPVLLCTGFSETMSEEKATSLGIKGFLLKPVVINDLAQKIREVLDEN